MRSRCHREAQPATPKVTLGRAQRKPAGPDPTFLGEKSDTNHTDGPKNRRKIQKFHPKGHFGASTKLQNLDRLAQQRPSRPQIFDPWPKKVAFQCSPIGPPISFFPIFRHDLAPSTDHPPILNAKKSPLAPLFFRFWRAISAREHRSRPPSPISDPRPAQWGGNPLPGGQISKTPTSLPTPLLFDRPISGLSSIP